MESKNKLSELQQIANNLENNKRNEIKEIGDVLYKDLVEVKDNAIVPEIIFKGYFLEHFYNLKTGTAELDSTLTLKWMELARGPYNEVDVIDNNLNILFTVPSLFIRPEIKPEELKGTNFNAIAGTYEAKVNRLHVDGMNYLTRELSSIRNVIKGNTDANTIRWVNIFNRYYSIQPVAVTNIASQQQTSNLTDFLEID